MSLLDLSLVTSSLRTLLEEHISASPEWPGSFTLEVSPSPPDQLEGDNVLGLYLYHVAENGHTRNLPPEGRDGPPIRQAPMGLDLHYQLTPHSDLDDETGPEREQLIMGLALKALHDYPVVDDSTELPPANGDGDPTPVLDPGLEDRDNRVRIDLQPVPHDQAVNFWTAGSSPLRLSAYYRVSIVLLEPEEPEVVRGPVLDYGVHTFVAGAPNLEGSENTLVFTLPGESEPRELVADPARVSPGGEVAFRGTDLMGDETRLWLRSAHWEDPQRADTEWSTTVTSSRVTTTVAETLGGLPVLPGVYGARVEVVRRREMPDGSVRSFEHASNETPFMIMPVVDEPPAGSAAPGALLTVTGYGFDDPRPPDEAVELEVEVFVGGRRLVADGGALEPGEFNVQDERTLELGLPAELDAGPAPVRVRVNGADGPPRWIDIS